MSRHDDPRDVDTVVLDVDGTLVDTTYHHTMAWTRAFAERGLQVACWRTHRAIGMGGDKIITHLAGAEAEASLGDALRERHDELFDRVLDDVSPLPGASDLLRTLLDRGFEVVLASSGASTQTERLLEKVSYADQVGARTSSADVEESKPSPDLVEEAIARVGGRSAVMIGDAVWDVAAAQRAGHPAIGLLCGGFGAGELLEAGASEVYDDPQDLVERIDQSLLSGR